MDVLSFALEKEKTLEKLYRDIAATTPYAGLKTIFTMLAETETGHVRYIQGMKAKSPDLINVDILKKSKSIFSKMPKQKEEMKSFADQVALYTKIMNFEQESEVFYRQTARSPEVKDENTRQILLTLADEEKKHAVLMENILEFVSRPQNWLEDAEWQQLEEY
jgi:rubrerythrin